MKVRDAMIIAVGIKGVRTLNNFAKIPGVGITPALCPGKIFRQGCLLAPARSAGFNFRARVWHQYILYNFVSLSSKSSYFCTLSLRY